MKKVIVLGVLLVTLLGLVQFSIAEETVIDEVDAEISSIEETTEAQATANTVADESFFDDFEDLWTFVVPLYAFQSPYSALVNADNMLTVDDTPESLIKVTTVKRATSAAVYMDEIAAAALTAMFEAAAKVTEYEYVTVDANGNEKTLTAKYTNGMILYLKSGYRSYGTQATTYNNYLSRNDGVDDGYVAQPGASEHQTGLCADILNADYAGLDTVTTDFADTAEAYWLKENCTSFGFILRYPEDQEDVTGVSFEPWHFRYVGQQAASYMMSRDLTLEEFYATWQEEYDLFISNGGNVDLQLLYEIYKRDAPLESHVMDVVGEDGDFEISLEF